MIPKDADPKPLKLSITNRILDNGSIRITIKDQASRIPFLEFDMIAINFLEMMRGHADSEANGIVLSLDKVGKIHEVNTIEFKIPNLKKYDIKEIKQMAKQHTPKGWIADTEFSSKDSFYINKEGETYARTVIRRWV